MGEFALVTVDRTRVEQLAEEGDRGAQRVLASLRRLSFELSSAQLGITITSIVLGFVGEPALARVVSPVLGAVPGVDVDPGSGVSVVVALALATVTQMVVGELMPKSWAIARPLRTARLVVRPFGWFAAVFGPLISVLNGAADRIVRLFGVEPREELSAVRSLDELDLLIRSSVREGSLDEASFPLLARAISFRGKTAAQALVPRGSVVALAADQTVDELVEVALRTGHSRFPVYRSELDDVVGAVHVKDVCRIERERWGSETLESLVHEVPVVPESRALSSLLTEISSIGRQLVVVIDEYGGLAGILTLEDVVEEIVGEIEDEYDRAPFRHVSGFGQHVVSGMVHRDELAEQIGFVFPEGDYETLAGFVLSNLGRIPEVGDQIEYEGWRIEVLAMADRRIDRLRILPPPATGEGGPSGDEAGDDESGPGS